ncbi:hypothetical protein [Roseovarius nanhaiticus]|uniref:hypothetical protein n=1 Tax=Roseovarius nanhaiticus TaxID=573024 RepID=UPI00249010BC|nr:hypothetical protein [Roseovarius nanhaiticus]
MAKIFAFPQSSGAAVQDGLEMFVDDGELLEFAPSDDGQKKRLSPQKDGKNSRSFDWTNQERADLYRAHALVQAARPGLECDQGVSDEGDPWFLIGDQHGDVFIHICRIDRMYVLDSVTLPQVLTGKDFKSLLDNFLLTTTDEDQKTAEPAAGPANVIRLARGGTLCLHPSMMIAALIWTILLEIDELALPISGPLADQNEDEGSTQDISLAPDLAITVSLTDSQSILAQEGSATLATGWNSELGQIQRDEKTIHAAASSAAYALTAVAAAAGLYTGAQALSALLGLGETEKSPSGVADATEQKTAHSGTVPLNPLADALAILSQLGEFDFVEGIEKKVSEVLTTLDATLTLPNSETLQAYSVSEVFTNASALLYSLGEEVSLNHGDVMPRAFEASGSNVVMTNLATQEGIETQTPSEAGTQQISLSGSTLQNISKTLTTGNFDVTSYNASSLKEWVATADDKLLKSYGIVEDEFTLEDTSSSSQGNADGTPFFGKLTDDARSFIQDKLVTSDIEIILFKNEILIFDKAAVVGSGSSISWQLDDGNVISMIGFSAEFSELFVA